MAINVHRKGRHAPSYPGEKIGSAGISVQSVGIDHEAYRLWVGFDDLRGYGKSNYDLEIEPESFRTLSEAMIRANRKEAIKAFGAALQAEVAVRLHGRADVDLHAGKAVIAAAIRVVTDDDAHRMAVENVNPDAVAVETAARAIRATTPGASMSASTTWCCSRVAPPRAKAICPIGSWPTWGLPASSPTVSPSSRASPCVSPPYAQRRRRFRLRRHEAASGSP